MTTEPRYGQLPELIGFATIDCKEMMFYQDMPIKMIKSDIRYEARLNPFYYLINDIVKDFKNRFGNDRCDSSYIYISAKRLFQQKREPYNRPGWHCDGFMSDDINYIWSDKQPTIFNVSKFDLSQDDALSMEQMDRQALPENNMVFPVNSILMLDQYNVHRVGEVDEPGVRTFLKITFSYSPFDLEGNTHNYLLDYNWPMRPRSVERNIPQLIKEHS